VKLPPALQKLTRNQWLIVVAALTAVVAGTFAWLLSGALTVLGPDPDIPPMLRRSDDASLFAQIDQKTAAIEEQRKIGARLDEVTRKLEGMKTEIEAARKRLPRDAQKGEMRQLIEDLARQVGSGAKGVVIKSVQIRESAPASGRGQPGDITTVEYSTQCVTDMDGLIQFINLIERNERFMTVEGIQITSGGVANDLTSHKVEAKPHAVSLRIVTYIDRGSVGTRR